MATPLSAISSHPSFTKFPSFFPHYFSQNPNSSAISVTSPQSANFRLPRFQKFELPRNFSGNAVRGKEASTSVPESVPVRVALELLQAGHRFLDVRTSEEFSLGHAPGAVNVPYWFRFGSGMSKNPQFLEEVLSHFGKDEEILVGCQVGKRSLMAAIDLQSAGFSSIRDVAGGHASWVENGLPVE